MPAHQRDLVQRRGLFRRGGKERPRARAALNPQVAQMGVSLDRVIAAVEPAGDLERILAFVVRLFVDPALGYMSSIIAAKARIDEASSQSVSARRGRVSQNG